MINSQILYNLYTIFKIIIPVFWLYIKVGVIVKQRLFKIHDSRLHDVIIIYK